MPSMKADRRPTAVGTWYMADRQTDMKANFFCLHVGRLVIGNSTLEKGYYSTDIG